MRDKDDLRAALRTLERHTPDADSILATIRERGSAAAPPRRGRRWNGPAAWTANWRRRMAPLAVAAAVLVTIAAAGLVAKVVVPFGSALSNGPESATK